MVNQDTRCLMFFNQFEQFCWYSRDLSTSRIGSRDYRDYHFDFSSVNNKGE